MALATKPKPKSHHRKAQAKHHKRSKQYMKPYWPYLPLFAIVGGGVALNKAWYNPSMWPGSADNATTRVEALTGSEISLAIVIFIAAAACGVFLFRHAYQVQRVINRGEAFIVRHVWFDVALVLLITAGVILSRNTLP